MDDMDKAAPDMESLSRSERKAREHIEKLLAEKPKGSWTVADYMALPDDGRRYELLNGDLLVCPAPLTYHQTVVLNLTYILETYNRAKRAGKLFFAPVDVVFEPRSVYQPDILFVGRERLEILGPKNLQGPPDLAVEVLSPSERKRDLVKKKRIYLEHGVAHYWIVDPEDRMLEENVLEEGAYRPAATLVDEYEPDAVFRPALFPDLEVRMKEVWEG
jgi:Uma2 family endonuclease